ncbi:hypothetical protein EXW51_00340 (plasmid) [Bacillus mycoides]|uniref:hypothetical protein n=1 Tax=Bacillus mycoides TaxID=1405 RepID=UPI001C035292|nr:hypothetical protein [Bacillus mycoides]QWH26565.1 hypothetical protein EXW51_00340 [Bacillus mycoides]
MLKGKKTIITMLCATMLGTTSLIATPTKAETDTKLENPVTDFGMKDLELNDYQLNELKNNRPITISSDAAEIRIEPQKAFAKPQVFNIKTYLKNSYCKDVLKNYNAWNSTNKWAKTVKYIVSLAPAAGLSMFMYDLGADRIITPIKSAVKQGKGVEMSYKYTIPVGTNIGKISNSKVTVK